MTYEDLPPGVRDMSLVGDPTLTADLIDLFVPVQDRLDGCLVIVVCDAEGRAGNPFLLELPERPSREVAELMVELVADAVSDLGRVPVVVAMGSRGRTSDRTWLRRVSRLLDAVPTIDRIGSYMAYPEGVVALEEQRSAAA